MWFHECNLIVREQLLPNTQLWSKSRLFLLPCKNTNKVFVIIPWYFKTLQASSVGYCPLKVVLQLSSLHLCLGLCPEFSITRSKRLSCFVKLSPPLTTFSCISFFFFRPTSIPLYNCVTSPKNPFRVGQMSKQPLDFFFYERFNVMWNSTAGIIWMWYDPN